MKFKKVIALLLAAVCIGSMASISAFAADEPASATPKTVLEYDFSTMTQLPEISAMLTQKGVEYSNASLTGGKLVVTNNQTKHCFVKLLDYAPSMTEGSDFEITLKASISGTSESAAPTNPDEHRIGISFNVNTDPTFANTVRYLFLKENGKFQGGAYFLGDWQTGEIKDGTLSSGVTVAPETEYTFKVHIKSNETVELGIYDANGTLLNPADANGSLYSTNNQRLGSAIGLYVRGCTLKASYFSVVSYTDASDNLENDDSGTNTPSTPEASTPDASNPETNTDDTKAPETNAPETAGETKTEDTSAPEATDGCGSVVALAPIMMLTAAGAVALTKKKRSR